MTKTEKIIQEQPEQQPGETDGQYAHRIQRWHDSFTVQSYSALKQLQQMLNEGIC